MRLLFPVAILIAGTAAPLPAKTPSVKGPSLQDKDCPGVTSQWVRDGNGWQHEPLKPRKLAELPPGESFAAVYRLDERGCMVPVEFRDVRR